MTFASEENSRAEIVLSREFPRLYAFYKAHAIPKIADKWVRFLRVARNTKPILDDLRVRGLDLVLLDQATPPGTDRRPLYETVVDWLPRIDDPLTMTVCVGRLLEPEARQVLQQHRQRLFRVAREWNERLRRDDAERTLSVLAQCVMRIARQRDIDEILGWITDRPLAMEARASYVFDLNRFAKTPGPARDALQRLVADAQVGPHAVWALARALRSDALPLLQDLRQTSPHETVRKAAAFNIRKLTARSGQLALPVATPAMLSRASSSTSIELDTISLPELLKVLEQDTNGRLSEGIADQLALSADQLKGGQRRLHVVELISAVDNAGRQLGFGFRAEDEDTLTLTLYFEPALTGAIESALQRFLNTLD